MFYNETMGRDDVDINITNTNQNVNSNMNENMNFNEMEGYSMQSPMGGMMSPIIEPGRERIINRTFVHEVPHV